jgi:glycosyltransferase involved in cell wall biosynthesis
LIVDAVNSAQRVADEVIVVDGHSSDQTAQLDRAAGARVILANKGRGAQLHAGALAATGEVLLFLHADARLPPEARNALERSRATITENRSACPMHACKTFVLCRLVPISVGTYCFRRLFLQKRFISGLTLVP